MLCNVSGLSSINARGTGDIDRLTQQWLDMERQTGHLKNDWQAQQPVLEQRLSLLQAEKIQLQKILTESNQNQSSVDERRAELLAEQESLEKQQQELSQALSLLVSRVEGMSALIPPPLKNVWQDEQSVLGEKPEISTQLQVALAQLSHLADFDLRIAVHQAPIVREDGTEILVKQLYLGLGMAWFVSADGQFAGWGQADDEGWQWHVEDTLDADVSIDAAEITKAIAIFEKHRQAEFVRLPVKLANHMKTNDVINSEEID